VQSCRHGHLNGRFGFVQDEIEHISESCGVSGSLTAITGIHGHGVQESASGEGFARFTWLGAARALILQEDALISHEEVGLHVARGWGEILYAQ